MVTREEIKDADMKTLWDRVKELNIVIEGGNYDGGTELERDACRDQAIQLDKELDALIKCE